MNILLDTHAFLWATYKDKRVTRKLIDLMESNQLYLSSISCFEIQQKRYVGKLSRDPRYQDLFESGDLIELPFKSSHAERTFQLPLIHRDPFDRMLIAQSMVEGIPLVTADKTIQQYDFEFIAV
ncbi:MAG: type II toxin-antitoxin system VapC family toxin [Cyclobacteriaceae bacterium]